MATTNFTTGTVITADWLNDVDAAVYEGDFSDVTLSSSGLSVTGNTALGDAEDVDTHAIKGATTLLANSVGAAMTITQTGAGNALVVEDSTNPDSTPFIITADGNVGIGLSAPTADIEVFRSGDTATCYVGAETGQAQFIARTYATVAPVLQLSRARGTKDSPTIVSSGDLLGRIQGSGWDGATFVRACEIDMEIDGTPGTNDMPGRIVFSTTPDGSTTTVEHMRITSTGDILMGTTVSSSQATELRIVNSQGRNIELSTLNTDATNKSGGIAVSHYTNTEEAFSLIGGTSTSTAGTVQIGGGRSTINAATTIRFYTAADNVTLTGTERVVIDSTGNLRLTSTGGLGYGTGSGGTVTQLTSKATGVTLNTTNGQIVTFNDALGAGAEISFAVTNDKVAATDVVIVNLASGGTTNTYLVGVEAVSAGSFRIIIHNCSASSRSEALTLNFAVIKAVTS